MKQVISGNDLRKCVNETIELLCGTVKKTLGPKGNNVIISNSSFSPFITNDGVTIAENIESNDPVINTILEFIKESSIKTNELVGDGTTTTLVLLEAIYKNGLEYINEGVSPIIIKNELDFALDKILSYINLESRDATDDDIFLIASNSANSEYIGKIISKVFLKVKNKNSITIKEGNSHHTIINHINGYTFETMLASPYFLKSGTIILNNPYILLINDYVNDIEMISSNLNFIINNKESLIIIAKDYSSEVSNEVLSLYLDEGVNVILLKIPEFGIREHYFLEDIKAIMDNKIDGFKSAKKIEINKDKTIISFIKNDSLKNYIKKLKNDNFDEDYMEDYKQSKIAILEHGLAEIIVGANTKTERRELKMRYDDALCAVSSLSDGIVIGGGITYYKLSEMLDYDNVGECILKDALLKPSEQILKNASLTKTILNEIKLSNYEKVYNIKKESFESVLNTTVLDPSLVLKVALQNACSIASMLLTTNSLVINEYKNELNKHMDFNEL